MSAVPQIPPEPRSSAATSLDRRIQMLRTAMGPLIATALEDPDVVEIMLNPTAPCGWIGCRRAYTVGRGTARGRWRTHHPAGGRPRWRGSASRPPALDRRAAGNRRTLRGHLAARLRLAQPSRCASAP